MSGMGVGCLCLVTGTGTAAALAVEVLAAAAVDAGLRRVGDDSTDDGIMTSLSLISSSNNNNNKQTASTNTLSRDYSRIIDHFFHANILTVQTNF